MSALGSCATLRRADFRDEQDGSDAAAMVEAIGAAEAF